MPTWIIGRHIATNVPQQNAGVWVGAHTFGGFDASTKTNQGQAPIYGFANWLPAQRTINVDQKSVYNGVIDDGDEKGAFRFGP
ncbi:hypothetical protein C7445_102175 [Alicyclobacillus sacchari]|uniref:Uncharacterized protein n=1 Tax=Alicyclobacillus sacchari TaxID=392010 RepID=A0A4R8LVD3_9BACL|nr:hypothetical protein [Alicyclobacillus sacchari]TDY50616.1 hypothetical protein C7445_102175 [Alicyclobacillus sacchari]GMA55576.1 hypothetical protein GCM10025858_00790 [Alicyclobacillus sacchari]GMA59182.1 hypothetical protein GCM10025858_36850 [Alicyclobacillus sacchari]